MLICVSRADNTAVVMICITRIIVFAVVTGISTCHLNPTKLNRLIDRYKYYANYSQHVEKVDGKLVADWTDTYQLKQVNFTTKFRVEMMRHTEYNFKNSGSNDKWRACIYMNQPAIAKTQSSYYKNEEECLKTANSRDGDRRKTINQIDREIKKWRKGYKYLVKLCDTDNPNNKHNSSVCLVQYMEADNYDYALQRLMKLKLDAMSDYFVLLNSSLLELEECLKTCFSWYLDSIRVTMDALYKCYNRKIKSE